MSLLYTIAGEIASFFLGGIAYLPQSAEQLISGQAGSLRARKWGRWPIRAHQAQGVCLAPVLDATGA